MKRKLCICIAAESIRTWGDYEFKGIARFKNVGVLLNRKNKRQDISERVGKGYKAFYCNKHLFYGEKLSKTTKLRVYRAVVNPKITYAAETMTLTKNNEEKLKVIKRKFIRAIMGQKKLMKTKLDN